VAQLVNLDAMIQRADFAALDAQVSFFEQVDTISVRDFTRGGLIGPSLRKPDFQRETNHWTPEQVCSLLECFVGGDLIPSVILWQSSAHLFVIDGGHRLSALRAWVEDDYGDGPVSERYFGKVISKDQRRAAQRLRELIAARIGTWQHFQSRIESQDGSHEDRKRINTVATRGLAIQWVKGDPEKAENSFFRINTKGTPLDDVEELLLRNRRKSIPIVARAVIRAGQGHRYWSHFHELQRAEIEEKSIRLHRLLLDPEVQSPIKTLDLPLGGPKGVRNALTVLIDFTSAATQSQTGQLTSIDSLKDDEDGSETIGALDKALSLASRLTGNGGGSLGLHPAVYFYGPTGRHSGPLFMGTALLIGQKLRQNDKQFFAKFCRVRGRLEKILIESKDLIATLVQKHPSARRSQKYKELLGRLIEELLRNDATEEIPEEKLIEFAGLLGRVVAATLTETRTEFSDDIKSQVFIKAALRSAIRCPVCHGYLDPAKSMSYDHATPVREGGQGSKDNCELTHPFCNQSVKQ
jgi:hypothetical protein